MVSGASTDGDRDTVWPRLVPCQGQRLGCCKKKTLQLTQGLVGGLRAAFSFMRVFASACSAAGCSHPRTQAGSTPAALLHP